MKDRDLTILLTVLVCICIILSTITAIEFQQFKVETEATMSGFVEDMRVIKEQFANLAYRMDVLEGRYG